VKKVWIKHELVLLNVSKTMAGPGHKYPDAIRPDEVNSYPNDPYS
jgi:hypothetical protein